MADVIVILETFIIRKELIGYIADILCKPNHSIQYANWPVYLLLFHKH